VRAGREQRGRRTINLPDGATLTIRPATMADIAGLEQL